MTKKSKSLRAFASSRETQKEVARSALVPFPGFHPGLVCDAPLEQISSALTGRYISAQGIALGQKSQHSSSPERAPYLPKT